jgi:hypothetical protein
MTQRRSPYTRPKHPTPIRLTERDHKILETLHVFDGMLSLTQVDQLFFAGRGTTQPRARMRALFENGYVNMPASSDVHKVPLGETIYWLDQRGAEVVAGLHGEPLKAFKWREKPRWSLIAHDLKVNDFRLMVMAACEAAPTLTLHRWMPESEFWSYPDRVTYKDHTGASRTRQVRPDGFFTIRRPAPTHPGKLEEFAFLLEIDMSTEDNPRFAREKVRPGVAYLKSDAYQERFGLRYGRWLVVTTGERRRDNMRSHTRGAGGKGLFYFTTFDQLSAETVLIEPIWLMADRDGPISLIPDPDRVPKITHQPALL